MDARVERIVGRALAALLLTQSVAGADQPCGFTDTGQRIYTNDPTLAVALGDLDGDGDVDAFLKGAGGGERVYVNGDPCPGDRDGDGIVELDDLLPVLNGWGTDWVPGDADCSGEVDLDDLLLVLGGWGPC